MIGVNITNGAVNGKTYTIQEYLKIYEQSQVVFISLIPTFKASLTAGKINQMSYQRLVNMGNQAVTKNEALGLIKTNTKVDLGVNDILPVDLPYVPPANNNMMLYIAGGVLILALLIKK